MDVVKDKAVCGTCEDWCGKRESVDEKIVRLSPSARGDCKRNNKLKSPQGGCDQWREMKTEETPCIKKGGQVPDSECLMNLRGLSHSVSRE